MSGPAIDRETLDHLLDITGGDVEFLDELVDTYLDDGRGPGRGAARRPSRRCGRGPGAAGPHAQVQQRQRRGAAARRRLPRARGGGEGRCRGRCGRSGWPPSPPRSMRPVTGCSRHAPNGTSPATQSGQAAQVATSRSRVARSRWPCASARSAGRRALVGRRRRIGAGGQEQLDELDVAAVGSLVERAVAAALGRLDIGAGASSSRQTSWCRPAAAAWSGWLANAFVP